MKNLITGRQQEILSKLGQTFGIDEKRILFLNPRDENEPWIPADELESIARQVGGFKAITVLHDKFIAETNQVAYAATVIDKNEISYTRSGVATLGEKPGNEDIDAETLASGRALGAALRAAGFHPYRSGSVVNFSEMREQIEEKRSDAPLRAITDKAKLRSRDLGIIHDLASKKGLIRMLEGVRDMTEYRQQLHAKFGVDTAVMMNELQRAAVINWLNNYNDFLSNVPVELREDALIA